MIEAIRVANHSVSFETALTAVRQYAQRYADVVRFYDCALTERALAAADVDLALFGRLAFVDSGFGPRDILTLFGAAQTAPWAAVPADAALTDADPAEQAGLYDAAEALHRHFLGATERLDSSTVSLALHLMRPSMFPILDSPIRSLYEDRAIEAWELTERPVRPRSRRSFWSPIRDDLLAAQHTGCIEQWRQSLNGSGRLDYRRLATVSDVRLWDALARCIALAGR